MKLTVQIMAAIALCAFAFTAEAACEYPASIKVPDGGKATKDEMIAGQQAVKQYMADMDAYLACLDKENAVAAAEGEDPEIAAQREALHVKRHNAAVEAMEGVAARFNEQVRAYKARSE